MKAETHQRLVCHVLALAVRIFDTKARRAVVLDDRALENAVPCAARWWPQRSKVQRCYWAWGTSQAVCVRASVPSNCLCTTRPMKASIGSASSTATPSRQPETDGKAPGTRLLRGCFAGGGFGGCVARFTAARRGDESVHATARATARAASSAVEKEPRCTFLPSRIARAWYREPSTFTPL